ncbi:hypothetical protein [Faecalibaculum rodentium]|uniref:hypothetical protein n=1 Tax=Faecalibaculum rodentium TaxID=1702221 RepID=UPI0023F17C70|nr:hypothetical protein [Faecalibaculum rodentium]
MDRLENMERHLLENPNDWQTSIAFMILRGKKISHSIKKKKNLERKKVAQYRRANGE